jgi:hypothetical protein
MSHSLGITTNSTVHKIKATPQYRSLEQLTVYNVITIYNLICLMVYILKLKPQNLLVRNNALPQIRKPPHNRQISLPISSFYTALKILLSHVTNWEFKDVVMWVSHSHS